MIYTLYTIGSILFILLFIITGYGVSEYVRNKGVYTVECPNCKGTDFEENKCCDCGQKINI